MTTDHYSNVVIGSGEAGKRRATIAPTLYKESLMANLLHIVASPRGESYSTPLAKAFLDAYRQARPEDRIETLDIYRADIPQFYAPAAKAKYALNRQAPRDEAEKAWRPVVETIGHFKRFDKYVVSSRDVELWHPLPAEAVHRRNCPAVAHLRLFAREGRHGPDNRPADGAAAGAWRRLPMGNPLEASIFRNRTCGRFSGSSASHTLRRGDPGHAAKQAPSRSRPTWTAIAAAQDAAHEFAGEAAA